MATVMKRLVTTAKTPEIEIAWPACPSVSARSRAMGLRRLTGMNSDAISTKTQRAIAKTALHAGRSDWARSSLDSVIELILRPLISVSRPIRVRSRRCSKHPNLSIKICVNE